MGGGGGGTDDVDLSYGAVEAMPRMGRTAKGALRPVVLQVVSPPWGSRVTVNEYRSLFSDGLNVLLGILGPSMSINHLVTGGDLRRGTVVRVLDYDVYPGLSRLRVIVVMQLEILQAECALIGSPTINEHYRTLTNLSVPQEVLDNLSSFPGQSMLDSSFVPREEHAVYNLQYGGCHGSTLPQNAVAAKMQELSLDDGKNQRFPVTTAVENFGPASTFGSSLPPERLLPSPVGTDRTRAAVNQSPCLVTPINSLSPYKLNWTIKARVTAKTDLRHYANARGPGKVFSFDLIDAQGGEIRVTCYNLQADRYFDLIEVDKVYLLSGGLVHSASKHCSMLNGDYEICANISTSIQVCPDDDDSSIPGQRYNFIQISEIGGLEHGSLVDLLAVVTSVSPSARILRKDGTGIQKRTLQLKDMSDRSVEITLWGKSCDVEGQKLQCLFESGSNPVLAIKGCRIIDFVGRSLATVSSTQLKVNPDFPEAERLRQWYLTDGKSADQEMSNVTSNPIITPIALLKDVKLGWSGKSNWITVRAKILKVNSNKFCYPACTLSFNGKQCKTKVTKNNDGTWNCSRCAVDFTKCEYRYLMTCQLQDPTGITYATAFNEAGMEIIGCNAEELLIVKGQDEAKWEEIMLGVCQKEYLFKLSVMERMVTFNGEIHVKCNIVGAEKLDA